MFDVFYSGKKPNLFVHEQAVDTIEQAQQQSRTRFFWFVNYLSDYTGFDFLWEPVPWQADQRHAWLDQYQLDAGVYLIPKDGYTETNYHTDHQVHRLPDVDFWHIPEWIDPASINPRWAPNPADPAYIYELPVEWDWDRVGGPEYRIPGATERKYMDAFVARTQSNRQDWQVYDTVDPADPVFRWHPNPFDPPMIYVFGNQWYPAELRTSVEYHVPGAVVKKYMDSIRTVRLPDRDRFICLYPCEFDWSWEPDPGDPPYIYVFGNQWWPAEKMPTVEYHVAGATERKYMDIPARLLSTQENWVVPDTVDRNSIDFSWRPDPGDAPYIYEFATQWQSNGGARYVVPGATDVKYIDIQHCRLSSVDNWIIPDSVDRNSIDFSWHPSSTEQPYIYEFATQWQSNGGARYVVPGATDVKYVEIQHRRLSTQENWAVPEYIDIDSIDFSWHPDATEQPYIYEFATQWQPNGGARYVVPGATDVKYVEIQHCRLPDYSCWITPDTVDAASVDYSWHPDSTEQPYIYEFATQWQPNGGARYVVPGATDVKYVEIQHRRLSNYTHWITSDTVDTATVDYSWHPSNTEQPYIYEFATQWQPNGGAVYTVPGATERKYVEIQHRRLPSNAYWNIPEYIDKHSVDFSWIPDNTEQPYIYEFATQWQPNGGALYVLPDAVERKYVEIQHRRLPNQQAFTNLKGVQDFDYSWHPDNTELPYNYVFGNQHWPGTEMATVVYEMAGATQDKFVDTHVAVLENCALNWSVEEEIDQAAWDWSWVPNPKDPPYIYVWGNQWNPPEFKASVKYHVPGATEVKYMDRRTTRLPQPQLFSHNLAVSKFDYSWEPNPFDPPMTYVFGNQWNSAVLEPTVVYNAGGTEIKYINDIIATVAQDIAAWELLDDIEQFDYSWRPDPTDPPYIYVFGNQWLTPEQRPALRYCIEGATEIKYMDHPRARRRAGPSKFVKHYPVEFDWSWEPDPGSPPYNYVFGNQYYSAEVMPTVEYHMEGAAERKYMDIAAQLLPNHDNHWHPLVDCEWDYTWRPEPGSPSYIYVFGNQWWSAEKMPTVEYHMPGATERKYMTGPIAKLLVDMTNWHIPKHVDLTDMDFSWTPDPGEPDYIYQFATQHQKTGGPQYRMPGATEFKYVDMMRAEVKKEAAPVFEIDHLDGNAGCIEGTVRRVRYFDNYRDTLIRLAKSLVGEYEHVWVCSSICDYTDFDFSWHPETWQSTMLHVFASEREKFGDTFYMHVPTFAERAEKKQLLEWYSVNYVRGRSVPRRPMPVIEHNQDSQVDAVKTTTWAGPLATFTTTDYVPGNMVTVPLWRKEIKTIVPLSAGATTVIVPRVAVGDIRTQLYDYAYIDKTHRMLKDPPLDIVFISNGEPNAKSNYLQMTMYLANESRYTNRVHVVEGVNGRVAAYHAAARASTTPWFFAVFAKLEVNQMFDWTWQPDRMQQPKHYIFHARNPVNGLVYGHQAMIAYNRQLVLANPGIGLDFTLDSPHEVVPILSGVAHYDTSPWSSWRTAFRECIKLKASLPDVESEYRLNKWLDVTSDEADPQWSRWGAEDAVEYYNQVGGDFAALKKSYEWSWLASYAFMKRNLTPDQ
jgi:hypothetical protein